ncbi:MAG: hypothetical protein RLP44_10000 [Aggregatilineales bacterium]
MKNIETTLGSLAPEKLGWINAHDHIIVDSGLQVLQTPDFLLDSVEKAMDELSRWQQAGGGAIVDAQPFGCGRNVRKLITISETCNVPIIVCTGFQSKNFYLPDHWQFKYDEDTIAELLYQEIIEGVDLNGYESPIVARSTVKAGFVKIASDYHTIGDHTRKYIRAIGQIYQKIAVPVLVHTEMGTAAEGVLDLLEAVGVPADKVMLCHIDRNPDLYMHKRLAARGAFLAYDTASRIKYQPTSVVINLIKAMVDAGFEKHLLLGGDMARRSYWKSYGGGPGFDYLLSQFTPRLKDEAIPDEILRVIWHDNPIRWLTT